MTPSSYIHHTFNDDSYDSTSGNNMNNESSLFAELSKQDLGDVDEGADIMGKILYTVILN